MLIKINNYVIFDALFFFYLNYFFNIYISYYAHPWLYYNIMNLYHTRLLKIVVTLI